MKRYFNLGIILSVFLVIFLSGCGKSSPTYQTIKFENDGNGFIQFYTNDPQYYNHLFAYTDTDLTNPTSFEVTVKKISGSSINAYGIVFGYQDIKNFYEVGIGINREYAIYKRVNGAWISIQDWSNSTDLAEGYNQLNSIKVIRVDTTSYTVTFNNGTAIPFSDSTFENGRYGFLTSIGSSTQENFPETPVDVRYKFNTQITGTSSLTSEKLDSSNTQLSHGRLEY